MPYQRPRPAWRNGAAPERSRTPHLWSLLRARPKHPGAQKTARSGQARCPGTPPHSVSFELQQQGRCRTRRTARGGRVLAGISRVARTGPVTTMPAMPPRARRPPAQSGTSDQHPCSRVPAQASAGATSGSGSRPRLFRRRRGHGGRGCRAYQQRWRSGEAGRVRFRESGSGNTGSLLCKELEKRSAG